MKNDLNEQNDIIIFFLQAEIAAWR